MTRNELLAHSLAGPGSVKSLYFYKNSIRNQLASHALARRRRAIEDNIDLIEHNHKHSTTPVLNDKPHQHHPLLTLRINDKVIPVSPTIVIGIAGLIVAVFIGMFVLVLLKYRNVQELDREEAFVESVTLPPGIYKQHRRREHRPAQMVRVPLARYRTKKTSSVKVSSASCRWLKNKRSAMKCLVRMLLNEPVLFSKRRRKSVHKPRQERELQQERIDRYLQD